MLFNANSGVAAALRHALPSNLFDWNPSRGTRQEWIGALTGVRAIAAWLVFFRHVPAADGSPGTFGRICREMHVGVSIFFVLSGFLITFRYYSSWRPEAGWFKTYFRNRVARIYPVFFALTLLSLVVFKSRDPFHWLANFTLLGGLSANTMAISQAWTLTVEEFFYASAPLLFFLMARQRFWLGLLLPLVVGYGIAVTAGMVGGWNPERFFFVLHRTYAGRVFEFVLGALAGLLVLENRDRLPGRWLTPIGLFGMVFVVCVLVLRQDPTLLSSLRAENGRLTNHMLVKWLFPFFTALFLLGLVSERTLVGRFLGTPPMQLLGRASYTFYLIHVGPIAGLLIIRLNLGLASAFVLLNLVSIGILLLYEEPMHRLIRGHKPRPHGAGTPSQVGAD
jgi:peptidoglycan/LPS O-acetylase OafA/YrhL